jgi:hypothetical protein
MVLPRSCPLFSARAPFFCPVPAVYRQITTPGFQVDEPRRYAAAHGTSFSIGTDKLAIKQAGLFVLPSSHKISWSNSMEAVMARRVSEIIANHLSFLDYSNQLHRNFEEAEADGAPSKTLDLDLDEYSSEDMDRIEEEYHLADMILYLEQKAERHAAEREELRTKLNAMLSTLEQMEAENERLDEENERLDMADRHKDALIEGLRSDNEWLRWKNGLK